MTLEEASARLLRTALGDAIEVTTRAVFMLLFSIGYFLRMQISSKNENLNLI